MFFYFTIRFVQFITIRTGNRSEIQLNLQIFSFMKWIFITLCFTGFLACQSLQKKTQSKQISTVQSILLLDSAQAAAAIIDDDMEGFFEQVTITEMSIQLKKNFPDGTPRKQILQEYQNFLETDVADFTADEKVFVQTTFEQVKQISNSISPSIFPEEIELIKTKARHYGPSVYYTRENRIIIPQNELDRRSSEDFLQVMFHELFHVYSRLNPAAKKALYQLIGFNKINVTMAELQMSDSLRRRILLNPDGIDFTYAIQLKDAEGKPFEAMPIIAANSFNFKPEQPAFFGYLSFNLYRIEALPSKGYQVITQADGTSTLSLRNQPDFFAQIKDNTQYIIHPDEIMADNFALLAMSKTDDPKRDLKQLSVEGQQLIAEMEGILKR